jgi:hypothetical protein
MYAKNKAAAVLNPRTFCDIISGLRSGFCNKTVTVAVQSVSFTLFSIPEMYYRNIITHYSSFVKAKTEFL